MSFLDLAKRRYSSRNYLDKEVEKEKIEQILEAGRIAPSANNKQPWHFIVITNSEIRDEINSCYKREWINDAPVVLVICGDHSKSWKRSYDNKDHCDIDVSIAVDHMTLAATDLGLATCWICAFDKFKCSKILELPEHIEPIVMLPLAYPADNVDVNRHSFQRNKTENVVHWEGFRST
ncbi:MAG: nitroreductase family protein [Bacteroidota bacterium]|nr:nitroreductase family protein [Bacteroidota bacterium]